MVLFVFRPVAFKCLLSFVLEPVIHIDKIDGYQIFTHNPKAKDISDAIDEILVNKETNIKVKLSPIEQDNIEETDFQKKCAEYFKENFETLATEAPLVLPTKKTEKFKEIVETMEGWCTKTNKSSSIKGLVLHSFSAFRHLEHFGFTREVLKDSLKIKAFSEAPIIVVYNPQKNVVLLIRNTESQDLQTDIKLGLDDLKMFILLFHDKLKKSNLKLISLVVADKAHGFELKCSDCINHVLSLEEIKELPTFENWYEDRTKHFEKESVKRINPDFIKHFLAKITGTVAATFIYGKSIPTLTPESDEKMENLTVLLTQEQMEVVYSQDKHIIIRGGFGCGKTIIAAAIFNKISESLKNDEKIYYICYDPRSELLNEITAKGAQTEDDASVKVFHNEERRNLSEIIKEILEKKESTRKVNFVVDEYDGEDLNELEAKTLNKIFNESLKQMCIVLVVQPLEKKRVINKIPQKRNRFDMLENVKLYQLNRVMRNSLEIHNLVKLTMDVLEKQQTVFTHEKGNKMKSKLKTTASNTSVSDTNTVTKLPDPLPGTSTKLSPKQEDACEDEVVRGEDSPKKKIALEDAYEDEDFQDEDSLINNIASDEAKVVPRSVKGIRLGDAHEEGAHEDEVAEDEDSPKKNIALEDAYEDVQYEDSLKNDIASDEAKVVPGSLKGIRLGDPHEEDVHEDEVAKGEDFSKRNITLEDAYEDKDVQDEDSLQRNIAFDEAKVVPGSVKGIRLRDPDQYLEENPRIVKLGLDEAQAISGSVKGNRLVENIRKLVKAPSGLFGKIMTKSEFRFEPVDKPGHKISTKKPDFFELGKRSYFQKVLSLLAIFEEREIGKSEQVVLHFDTGENQIPNIFRFLFARHFKIEEKLTTKYKEFKTPKKSILVCSYPAFRGLEHSKITVVIDCDIYYVQHYLVETLARCTSDLCVVVLKNTATMAKVTTKWKTKQAIQQREIKISEDALQGEDFVLGSPRGSNTKIINAKFRSEYYKKLEKEFAELVTEDKNFESKTEFEAREIITER